MVEPQRGRPFEAGNKLGRGRPRGSRNKRTLLVHEVLDKHTEALTLQAVLLARQGNVPMLKALLAHILPRNRDQPVKAGPLAMGTAEDLVQSSDAIIKGVEAGKISIHEAHELFEMLETRRRLIHTAELEARVRNLEQRAQVQTGDGPAMTPPGDQPPEYTV